MTNDKRHLFTADAQFAVKTGDGQRTTLTGYAMVWGALSSDRGGYAVRLLPNSARFEPTTFALYHHDYRYVLGRNDDGSLRISSDDIGVRVEIDLPDTSYGRDLAWLVSNKKVRGMSFAMMPGGVYTETEENGKVVENYTQFSVDEVTVTPIPAFTATSVSKLADTAREEKTELSAERTEELPGDVAKLEEYRLKLYALPLAEIQAAGSKQPT